MDRRKVQSIAPESIRKMNPQRRPAHRNMKDLPHRGIPQVVRRQRILRLRNLL
jgi:hypothetical protein